MPCSICAHPEVAAIAAAVQRGDSLRQVEAAYRVNKSSLSRHTRQCLTAVSVAPQAGDTPALLRDPVPSVSGQPTAPAHLVNPQIHHQLTQIYIVLSNHNYLVDARRGLLEVVAQLLQVVRDSEE